MFYLFYFLFILFFIFLTLFCDQTGIFGQWEVQAPSITCKTQFLLFNTKSMALADNLFTLRLFLAIFWRSRYEEYKEKRAEVRERKEMHRNVLLRLRDEKAKRDTDY